jgi:hypothetical protein
MALDAPKHRFHHFLKLFRLLCLKYHASAVSYCTWVAILRNLQTTRQMIFHAVECAYGKGPLGRILLASPRPRGSDYTKNVPHASAPSSDSGPNLLLSALPALVRSGHKLK